ncbi:MAG: family 20 glycosylhydrolase [Clostridia bacterium]|nr:family 20 glycosylhydrolase [Clostridia bacterium]
MELIALQIDLARQKEHVKYVNEYVDFAKANGYNAVVLYFENAVRTDDTPFFESDRTYSMDEIREIVAHSEKVGIELIPVFENLGHLEKFFEYPQLAHMTECEDTSKDGRGFDVAAAGLSNCGCVSNPDLYAFFDKYVRDVASLFPGRFIHMGLDEPFDFAVCERCRAELAKGKTRNDMFLDHILHTHALISSLGKRMMMWDDFFEYADIVEKLPRDIIFCNWNYEFISDEPSGHWTNRIRKDWFTYYEKLGFDYLFCPQAQTFTSYNVDSFTRYAEKHHPFGALMTTWERSDKFYLAAYPLIAYAGRRWSGRITEAGKADVYTEILGNRDLAELTLSLQIPWMYYPLHEVGNLCQNDYAVLHMFSDKLQYAVPRLKAYANGMQDGLQKDIATEIYGYTAQKWIYTQLDLLAVELYDAVETGAKDAEYFETRYAELTELFADVEMRERALWEKYRKGLPSERNAFNGKFEMLQDRLQGMRKFLAENVGKGVLYIDFGLNEAFGTPRGIVKIKYADEQEEREVYQGGMKPGFVAMDFGGTYGLRFIMENKPVEWLTFTVYGEGSMFPMHFRYSQKGEKYVAADVEVLEGYVVNERKVLSDDTRFAEMGYDDGVAHFNDLNLCRKKSSIRVRFKPLA